MAEVRFLLTGDTSLCVEFGNEISTDINKQIRAFNQFRAGFYAYDSSKYPATDKTIITPTPDLEKYY